MIPLKFVAGGRSYCFDGKKEREGDELLVSDIKGLENANNLVISSIEFGKSMSGDMSQAKAVADICKHMALCHSVIIDPETQTYNSTSPDELALVEGAKNLGYEFKARNSDGEITILMDQLEEKYLLHNVFEFNSDRKRMSVVLQDLSLG